MKTKLSINQKNLNLPYLDCLNRRSACHRVSNTAAAYTALSLAQADDLAAGFLAIIGLIALTMSIFTFYQSRRQAAQMKIDIPKVMTTIECKKCGTKTVREFQRGDYVYKELDACQKCPGTKQLITAIYKEVKEKEKTYNV